MLTLCPATLIMKIVTKLSPNFSQKRSGRIIKFVIIHYTGMQSEIESIDRLQNPNSKVSCHYLINRKGIITKMVEDKNLAWHAGKSKWKNYKNLNSKSIGIELVNRGHKFGYEKFSNSQIKSLISLCKNLKKKYNIKSENFLGHSDIAPLRKIDPGEKFPWEKLSHHKIGKWYQEKKVEIKMYSNRMEFNFFKNLKILGFRYFNIKKRNLNDKKIIKSFQSHYNPRNVSGKIDQKTFKISHFLTH